MGKRREEPQHPALAVASGALELAEPAMPFAFSAAASAAAFTVGMAATQLACYGLRLSCATPLLASAAGCVGVGVASALAGQASLAARHSMAARAAKRGDPPPPAPPPPAWRRRDVALDAALGIALFKAMGGRYRALLPSDLVKPGACAVESLPAPGSAYAQGTSKGELVRLFRRDGCHHCGSRRGRVVGDHIPPNKDVYGVGGSTAATAAAAVSHFLASSPTGRAVAAAASAASSSSSSRAGGGGYASSSGLSIDAVAGAAVKATWEVGKAVFRAAGLGGGGGGRKALGPRKLTRTSTTFFARHRAALGWRLKDALGLNPVRQRYYPQCRPCSFRQAAAVRTGSRTLQLHAGGARPWYYAGTLVGLRHYADPARAGPPAGRGGRFAGGGGGGWGGGARTTGPFAGIDLDKSALDDLAAAVGRMQAAAASAASGITRR